MSAERILDNLNEQQRLAAAHLDGPALVIAGAGSGKTRTLTHRIAYLLAKKDISPSRLLVLTFTNKAAEEMRERIIQLIGEEKGKRIYMGTFHSIFARILRAEIQHLEPYTSNFTIYDTNDSKAVLKEIIAANKIKIEGINDPKKLAGFFQSFISNLKSNMKLPEDLTAKMFHGNTELLTAVRFTYKHYQLKLKEQNAMDFDDLLVNMYLLLQNPEVAEKYQTYFQYISVDEYQDTNRLQFLIISKLAEKHRNIYVVGDDSQSIYAFRGANVENILSFPKVYPEAKVYKLEKNYRSTTPIVNAANNLIKNNPKQLPKTLVSVEGEGEPVYLIKANDDYNEAYKVVDKIREIKQRKGYTYKDFAILYRSNYLSRNFENALRQAKIPYKIVGGTSFYDRKEVKDVISYLRVILNPKDMVAFFRIINYPARGIGKKTIEKIVELAAQNNVSAWDIIAKAEEFFTGRTKNSLQKFYNLISNLQELAKKEAAETVIDTLIKAVDFKQELQKNYSPEEAEERMANIYELLNAAKEYSNSGEDHSLEGFLTQISLLSSIDEDKDNDDKVRLLTVHASKGLEFTTVFIVGAEEGSFPSYYTLKEGKSIDEDRRLFYVAITRAKRLLFISFAASRMSRGFPTPRTPSRFLLELGEENIKAPRSVINYIYKSWQEDEDDSLQFRRLDEPEPVYKKKKTTTATVYKKSNHKPEDITIGSKVLHPKFGIGKVLDLEGAGEDMRLTVDFYKNGKHEKIKLIWKFAKLEILN